MQKSELKKGNHYENLVKFFNDEDAKYTNLANEALKNQINQNRLDALRSNLNSEVGIKNDYYKVFTSK